MKERGTTVRHDPSRTVCECGPAGDPGDITFFRGDANSDQAVNISDAVFTLDYLFAGGLHPTCPDAADANDNGSVDVSDAVAILNELFVEARSGIAPPYPEKGMDPTADELPPCRIVRKE